ncbi:MAG: BamA/TamA family outer membrane protein [Rikenellaceae bacterium]|nr:BamA/TamA family outer membrane protein [Rikenellaceae bacterium]
MGVCGRKRCRRGTVCRSLPLLAVAAVALLASCSTTSRLQSDEQLYTGVRKIRIEGDSGVVVSGAAESAARSPLSVKPNNPLFSPYVRTPFPVGLWVYNHFYTPKEKGFKYWIYKKLAKDPVLVSQVQPDVRSKVVVDILGNYGYFSSSAGYELLPSKRNPKKARISYDVRVAPPFFYSRIAYPQEEGELGELIDSLRQTSLLRVGAQYNLDTLSAERSRITDTFRSRGYYYFRPEYLAYEADTTQERRRVDLRLALREGVPPRALDVYSVGKVSVSLQSVRPGEPDTIDVRGMRVAYQKPLRIRPAVLARLVDLHEGQLFTVEAQNRTQNNLGRLGIFRSVNLNVTPLDSVGRADTLDVCVEAAFDMPLESNLEVDVSSKSNSYAGPGIIFGVTHRNLFRGGEVFTVKANGSYEWQTGSRKDGVKSSLLNSYELGLNATLAVPRLIPHLLGRNPKYPAKTNFQLGADLMNRPRFFHMISFSGSAGWDFQTSPYSYHSLTVFKLTYNNLLSTSASFDETMAQNPAIALSFKDQFIPMIGYTYTFDKSYGGGRNRLFWQNTATQAGNILSGAMELFRHKEPKQLFGNEFSQFVKGISEIKWYRRIGQNNTLATRFLIGAGCAYGNSKVMPYSEQFYIGGANSIRAFTIRSLGPGSYRPPEGDRNGYFDQTGDFKLEANVEFRFKIISRLSGAVFLDAGNIWLLRPDPARPGGLLTWRGLPREIALGTGVGLRVDISVLVLRADLGIGLHTPYPNPEKRGYYNISSFKDGLGLHIAIGYPF